MVTETKDRGTLRVLSGSDFEASCDCEDWQWHQEVEQSPAEFTSRKVKAGKLEVVEVSAVYGTVVVKVRTQDNAGSRNHEVILSRGDGIGWSCKHIIRALTTKALMPEHGRKKVFLLKEEAEIEAQKHSDSVVATVNNSFVVGIDYRA